ncbi:hypothetical protein E4T56_gene20328 [Termitomyces sp. T112]|nr:hypothetical protein E4T56_gene20328 [Termitomyces sp. T112]
MTSQGKSDETGTMDPASARITDVVFQAVQIWLVAQFQAQDTKLAEVLARIAQLEAAQALPGLATLPVSQAPLEHLAGVQVMQHVARTPRINTLEVYNGKSKQLADQFVRQVEAAAEFEIFRDDCQKILWAQSYLSGSAQQWSSVVTTGSDDPAQDALTWIGQLQQGSKSITDYCTAFFELKGRLGQADADSEYVKDCFWKGLTATLMEALVNMDFMTAEEARDILLRRESWLADIAACRKGAWHPGHAVSSAGSNSAQHPPARSAPPPPSADPNAMDVDHQPPYGALPIVGGIDQGGGSGSSGRRGEGGGSQAGFCVGLPRALAAGATGPSCVFAAPNGTVLHGPDEVSVSKQRRWTARAAVIHAWTLRSDHAALELLVTLQVRLPGSARIVDTCAMVDSGASCCFVNQHFVKEQQLPTVSKRRPVRLRMIDNTEVKSGLIMEEVHLHLVIGPHEETVVFDVADIGDDNLILGVNWLCCHSLSIDWGRSTIDFTSAHCRASCLQAPERAVAGVPGPEPSTSLQTPCPTVTSVGTSGQLPTVRAFVRKAAQRAQVVRVAQGCIDKAIEHVEAGAQESSGDSVFLEQQWDMESKRGCAGPYLADERGAAGWSFSQELAEEDARRRGGKERMVEELVLGEFHEFLGVFDKRRLERLPAHTKYDLGIKLLEGAEVPPPDKLYQLAPAELRALREFIDENLAKGYIRQSSAPCRAPVFFVKKKDGGLCLVVDFRAMNAVTKPDAYPIPLTNKLLDRLKAVKVFTMLDMHWGYYNVRIRDGDEWKTSFWTRYGQFEFLVMQFGLRNAPAVFQRMVNDLFHDLVDVYMVLYLDDIIIFSENPAQHDAHVREVLRRLREADLFLKPEKCRFRTTEVDYLGLKISPGRVGMDPVKVDSITSWPVLRNLHQVNQFLGFCNFYRRFVEDYAVISKPLEKLKAKDCEWRWGVEEQMAFESLKATFARAPVLMMPDTDAQF